MERIRIQSNVEIEVNDKGDKIIARLEDANFIHHFQDLGDFIRNPSVDTSRGVESIKEYALKGITKIDNLFGDGSSAKIFGENVLPTPYMFAMFLSQLLPIFEGYQKHREEDIMSRYNADRKGESYV